MGHIRRLVLTGIIAISTPVFAADVSMEELKKVQNELKAFNTLSVDFDQTRTSLRGKLLKSSGKATFVRPGRFRWQLVEPERDEWIYNGKDLINYKPTEKAATRYKAGGERSREIDEIVDTVMNLESLLQRYDVTKATRQGDVVAVELKPKKPNGVTGMKLDLDTKNDFVSKLGIVYDGDKPTTITFKNPNRQAVSEKVFDLPKGVKVTDMK